MRIMTAEQSPDDEFRAALQESGRRDRADRAAHVKALETNPARTIPREQPEFEFLENPELGLREPPEGLPLDVEVMGLQDLPHGSHSLSAGKGSAFAHPTTWVITPDGRVYEYDSNMSHGGHSGLMLKYVTKWFDGVKDAPKSGWRLSQEPSDREAKSTQQISKLAQKAKRCSCGGRMVYEPAEGVTSKASYECEDCGKFEGTDAQPGVHAAPEDQTHAKSLWQMPRFSQSTGLKDCQRCKGEGGYYKKLRNLGTGNYDEHYVQCDMPGCRSGKYDPSTLCQECHDANGHELPLPLRGKPGNGAKTASLDPTKPWARSLPYIVAQDAPAETERSRRLRQGVEASGYVWHDCSGMSEDRLSYLAPMDAMGSERAEVAERVREGRWSKSVPASQPARKSKMAKVIPDDGIADGGEPYTNEEMDLMAGKAETDKPRVWYVKVYLSDGSLFVETRINGTQTEITDYYTKQGFVLEDETTMVRPARVEFVKDLGDVPWMYYGESARPKEDKQAKSLWQLKLAQKVKKCPSCFDRMVFEPADGTSVRAGYECENCGHFESKDCNDGAVAPLE